MFDPTLFLILILKSNSQIKLIPIKIHTYYTSLNFLTILEIIDKHDLILVILELNYSKLIFY